VRRSARMTILGENRKRNSGEKGRSVRNAG
jgi:hypothetical protein